MNVTFLELTMRNFLSYGNDTTTVNLNFNKPTLIVGRNYDSVVEGQVDSNGAGKSTILNALLLCLFDNNLTGVEKDKQINNINEKNMELSVTFKADNVYYKVVRYRKNKAYGGDGVRLYKNPDEPVFDDSHDKTPDSVKGTNAEIEEILGIPYEMFIRIVVFSATHEPFLSLPSSHASKANQREIIEELFGLTELTLKAEQIKLALKDDKQTFKALLDIDERVQAELARHMELIANNNDRIHKWDIEHQMKYEQLEDRLNKLKAIDVDLALEGFAEAAKLEAELQKAEKNLPTLQAELKNLATQEMRFRGWEEDHAEELDTLQERFDELKGIDFPELKRIHNEQEALVARLQQKQAQRPGLVTTRNRAEANNQRILQAISKQDVEIEQLEENTCPYCKQEFAEAKVKIHECETAKEALAKELKTAKRELADADSELKILDLEIEADEASYVELKKTKIPHNLESMEREFNGLEEKLATARAATNPYTPDEDALHADDINAMIKKITTKADGIRAKIGMAKEFVHSSFKTEGDVQAHLSTVKSSEARLAEVKAEENPFVSVGESLNAVKFDSREVDKINELDKLIKHKEFLVKILTKKDSFVRKALLNKNIPLLNTRLRYYLDRVGLPHKVQFNEEMGVDISQFGASYEYGQFSSGQKARVNICLAFAFRDVLQSRFAKMNLSILDECLDTGLGTVGVSLVAKMIKHIAVENKQSMFVISHRDEIVNMFDSRLEIELRNGFSTILDTE